MRLVKQTQTLDSIQALRSLSALLILVYHSGFALAMPGIPAFAWVTEHIIKRGYVGVDVFFVVSGFIIAWTAVLGRDTPEQPIEFIIRRFFRVVPVYWLLSAVHAYFLNPLGWTGFIKSLAFIPTDATAAPYFGYPALYVGWSLNYQAFFYAVCMFALWAGRRALVVIAAVLVFTTLVSHFSLIFLASKYFLTY